jgi:hypothetical protein
LWRDRLTLALAPERIVLVRGSGGPRPKLLAKTIVPVTGAEAGWKAAVDTMARTLKSDRQWQDALVSVVLSNSFVRYQLVPSSDEINGAEERDAYVRQSFTQVYGDAAAAWVFAVSDAPRGAAWLVCAMDRDLLLLLEQSVTQSNSKLVSVAPHIMPTFNSARHAIKRKDCWFVQVEKDRLLLALISGGHWQTMSSRKIVGERWQQELPLLLERELRLYGMSQVPREVVFSAPEAHQAALDGAGKWVFHWLRPALRYGLTGRAEAPFAMALGA